MPFAHLRHSAALASLVVTAACSPYVYETEVTAFTKGVTAITTAEKNGTADLAKARRDHDHTVWNARLERDLDTADCGVTLSGCRLIDRTPTPFEAKLTATRAKTDDARQRVVPFLNAISAYAMALGAITNSKDVEELGTAQSDLQTALAGLATTQGASPQATAQVSAVANLFSTALTSILNRRRHAALKSATAQAHGDLVKLEQSLMGAGRLLADSMQVELNEQINTVLATLKKTKTQKLYAERLAELSALTTRLAALQSAQPETMVTTMITAHEKLRDALQDNAGQSSAVLKSIREFAEAARLFAVAINT